jgi:drug/metabolite transporter (DMT)-like permease
MNIPWYGYVILAGLAWGCYVPLVFYGGTELGGKSNARLTAILCVGIAYFVIAVLFPLMVFLTGQEEWPKWSTTGLVFSSLAGVAGAAGAICVIFASKSAVAAGMEIKKTNPAFDPATFRTLIAPLIFGVAPVINTLLSSVWHPKEGHPFHFTFAPPGWKMWLGVVMIGAGVFLVLKSKEDAEEAAKKKAAKPAPAVASAAPRV